jgi:hypothetical protein
MANESPRPTPADDPGPQRGDPLPAEEPVGGPRPVPPPDPLDALSDRLRAAQDAAERLVREATEAATQAARDPSSAGGEPSTPGPSPTGGGPAGPGPGAPGAGPSSPGPGAAGSGPSGRPPPRGYATQGSGEARVQSAEAQALAALIDLGRTVVPPELRRQLADLIRELLLLVRAVIDWYLERLEQGRHAATEVEDIPIG